MPAAPAPAGSARQEVTWGYLHAPGAAGAAAGAGGAASGQGQGQGEGEGQGCGSQSIPPGWLVPSEMISAEAGAIIARSLQARAEGAAGAPQGGGPSGAEGAAPREEPGGEAQRAEQRPPQDSGASGAPRARPRAPGPPTEPSETGAVFMEREGDNARAAAGDDQEELRRLRLERFGMGGGSAAQPE